MRDNRGKSWCACAGAPRIIVRLALAGVLSAVGNFGPAAAFGMEFSEQSRLYAREARIDEYFGYHAAVSGDGSTLAVGAHGRDTAAGATVGNVHVYVRSGDAWVEQARLQASNAMAGGRFGITVALSDDGNTLAVGSHRSENSGGAQAGNVYVFTRSDGAWTEQARLQASDAAPNSFFGVTALSSDGNTLAVGSYLHSHAGVTHAGSVYVLVRSGGVWTEQAQLRASDASASAVFGISVALSSDANTLAVSAYAANNSGGSRAGKAYVFVRSDGVWTEQARLQASDAAPNAIFATRVALSADGNTLAAGAYHAPNSAGEKAGNAYVFVRSDGVWTEQARLQASDAAAGAWFGSSVALSADGNLLAVGAQAARNSGGDKAGNAYVFTRSAGVWTERARLQASDASAGAFFGTRVALSADGNLLAVGAYAADNPARSGAGSAYVFLNRGSKKLD